MPYKPKFGSRHRDFLYSRDSSVATKAGRGCFPICPHCDLPVTPGQSWDECHVGTPDALGGKSTSVGHRLCNRLDNNLNVTPTVAKVKRVRLRHLGITGPGLGPHPLPAGRRSNVSRGVNGKLKARETHAQKHAAFMARRYPFLAGETGQPQE